MITLGGETIEIKPTKLKYMRNHTAAFYKVLELYPLPDVLAMEAGAFEDDRDGDKAVFDWLIAVTDDPAFVKRHYNDMTAEAVETLLSIYRRINRIDEKENTLKNLVAQRKEAE